METKKSPLAITERVNFVALFDCESGNPNGNPDNDNYPRVDPLTGLCMVTNCCIKRKIRNFIDFNMRGKEGYDTYVRRGTPLDSNEEDALVAVGAAKYQKASKTSETMKCVVEKDAASVGTAARDYLCQKFYDVRAFGGVMTRLKAAGVDGSQLRGPVWISDAWSQSPVQVAQLTMTRCTPQKRVTTTRNADGEEVDKQKQGDFGHKYAIPYALFRFNGGINIVDAEKTGFSDRDLSVLFDAILGCMDIDTSSGRKMNMRKLIVFRQPIENDPETGRPIYTGTQSYVLEDLVTCKKVCESEYPLSFKDYEISVDQSALPKGVTCEIVR